jgi:alkanesulfonate monooxygenase SsuD/methylene tetrahydromethanopterin reductase-like flavin-dependent oxidoreductase (luciferase family)
MAQFALRFNLRNRPDGPTARADLYGAMLDMCAWGDRVGADYLVVGEHHGAADGYMSAPLAVVAAIVGRTSRLPVIVACLLAPVNDPIRIAEEMVALDLFGRGRVSVAIGAGYRPEEFEMYGVDRARRGQMVEEFVHTLRRAWTGEPFEYRGRTVVVTPTPYSSPHPPILMAGSQPPSARRAARLGLPYFPAVNDPELRRIYFEECARLGVEGRCKMPGDHGFVFVSDDPERDWARLLPYIRHDAGIYDSWQTPDVRSSVHVASSDPDAIRRSGVYLVLTPDETVALAHSLGDDGALLLHPLMAGMPPELGWESLERFEHQVLARLPRPAASSVGS